MAKKPYSLVYDPRLQQILADARQRIAAGQGISHDEFWKQMAKQKAATKSASWKTKSATKRASVRIV
jgi:redox-sensitive bicupin YhaK (pirin superfamily)